MSSLLKMSALELKNYILDIQSFVQNELSKGIDIDDFLDETDVFDQFEDIIPDEEFPIFVIIGILNRSEYQVFPCGDLAHNLGGVLVFYYYWVAFWYVLVQFVRPSIILKN